MQGIQQRTAGLSPVCQLELKIDAIAIHGADLIYVHGKYSSIIHGR